jgi:hypothetical protein
VDMAAVEPLEGAVSGATACCEERGHRRLDAVPAPILRSAPRHGFWVKAAMPFFFPIGTVA